MAGLRKPPLHVWAVNRLARAHPLAVTRLLSAAASVAESQQAAMTGQSEAGRRLRQDSADYQRALDLGVREALTVLSSAGRAATEETARRVREVLAGAATGDQDLRSRLTTGTLATEQDAAVANGFGFSVADVAAAPAARPPTRRDPKRASGPPASPPVQDEALPADLRRELHRARLEARKLAESAAATAARLREVSRRARRRAAIAAAASRVAEDEALAAEAASETAAEAARQAQQAYLALGGSASAKDGG